MVADPSPPYRDSCDGDGAGPRQRRRRASPSHERIHPGVNDPMTLHQLATGTWYTVVACGALGLSILWPGPFAVDASPAAQQLRGSHEGVLGPVHLHAGLLVLHARSNGSESFAVDVL